MEKSFEPPSRRHAINAEPMGGGGRTMEGSGGAIIDGTLNADSQRKEKEVMQRKLYNKVLKDIEDAVVGTMGVTNFTALEEIVAWIDTNREKLDDWQNEGLDNALRQDLMTSMSRIWRNLSVSRFDAVSSVGRRLSFCDSHGIDLEIEQSWFDRFAQEAFEMMAEKGSHDANTYHKYMQECIDFAKEHAVLLDYQTAFERALTSGDHANIEEFINLAKQEGRPLDFSLEKLRNAFERGGPRNARRLSLEEDLIKFAQEKGIVP